MRYFSGFIPSFYCLLPSWLPVQLASIAHSLPKMSFLKSAHDILKGLRETLFFHLEQSNVSGFKTLAAQIIESYGKEVLLQTHDGRRGFEGKTLLHQASSFGNNEIVRYLISLGHPVDIIDSSTSKVTPLMDAIGQDLVDTSVLLVESGAKLELQDINNENAFHYAARNGSSKLIKALVKASEGTTKQQLIELVCVLDIKKRFPEDLATRSLAREVLYNFRTMGYHPMPVKKNKQIVQEERVVSKNIKF